MELPQEMELINLSDGEYQLIGQITVISGMIEQELKEAVVRLVKAPWPDGLAITAHLNFGSLCDMTLALLPSTVPKTAERENTIEEFTAAIAQARAAYNGRNSLIHGPFSPWSDSARADKTASRLTARGKIKRSTIVYDEEALKSLFNELSSAHHSLKMATFSLERARDELAFQRLLSRIRGPAQKANPRK